MTAPTSIVWLREDLRLADHAALTAALDAGGAVVPVYVLDESQGAWAPGGATRWWLDMSLAAHAERLAEHGARLILRRGPTVRTLTHLVEETKAGAVHAIGRYEPEARKLEAALAAALEKKGVPLTLHPGALLHDPERVRTQAGLPFKIYAPFWRAFSAVPKSDPLPAPRKLSPPTSQPKSDRLADWRLLPTRPDWAGGLRDTWRPGEGGARKRLDAFLAGPMRGYGDDRNRPDREGTSRLSPHLHFGEISPAACWHAAEHAGHGTGPETFRRELAWREFSAHLLNHVPSLPEEPFRPEFKAFPWKRDDRLLRAWQKGLTGYPIVDAGMRQLWATGWMHNRVRMIAASFLIKDLLIPWTEGEAWFWDTLVDADLANNAASWQWVAGCGADAAPYFRVFNPVKQGATFDPDGEYVRRWVPELAKLPAAAIHAPWTVPSGGLAMAGITLGKTYPRPIVDHKAARLLALDAFAALRGGDGARRASA
jgi:deoxyribodipyrimidine photo-lyase